MKWLFKTFFKALRVILGPVLLLQERLATPKGLVRSSGAQQAVDMQCRNLALYQFKTCPFCIKVRQEMRRLSLKSICATPGTTQFTAIPCCKGVAGPWCHA